MALVKFTLDMENPPDIPQEYLDRFDAIREEDIDYSDIPEMDDEFWKHAKIVPNPFKSVVTMRLEPETIAFFKGDNPKGYTGRMAAVLKAFVKAQRAG